MPIPTVSGTAIEVRGDDYFTLFMDPTPGDAPIIDPDAPLGLQFIGFSETADDMADNPTVQISPQPRPGASSANRMPDPNEWFMNEWWIFDRPVEFGNISTDKVITVDILNTFRDETHSFDAVDLSALPGVTNTAGNLLPPQNIRFLEQIKTDFTAAAAGASSFDANAIYTFDNAVISVRYTGTRIILFVFPPEKPVTEQLSWRSDIMRSRDQSEQRHSLRVIPRQVVSFDYKPQTEQNRAALRNVLKKSQFLQLGVPEWWDERPILNPSVADIAPGATVIPCNPDNAMFFADRSALILLPDDTFFDVSIISVQPGVSVTLDQATTFAIPLNSAILPLATGFLMGSPALSDWVVNLDKTSLNFEFFSTEDIAFTEAEFQANTFFEKHPVDSLLVMTDPNFVDGVTFSHQLVQDRTIVDSGVGRVDVNLVDAVGIPIRGKGVTIHSREDIWQWKQLLHFLRGSFKQFYLPTFQRDLPVTDAGYDLSSSSILIEDIGLTEIGFLPPFRDIFIQIGDPKADRHFVRRITNIIDNGNGTETVFLNAAPQGPVEVIPRSDVLISHAILCRIEGDVATFVHEYLGEATIRMKVRGLVQ